MLLKHPVEVQGLSLRRVWTGDKVRALISDVSRSLRLGDSARAALTGLTGETHVLSRSSLPWLHGILMWGDFKIPVSRPSPGPLNWNLWGWDPGVTVLCFVCFTFLAKQRVPRSCFTVGWSG